MIEAEQAFAIDANINGVWDYVKDMRRWATLFPGCRECETIDEHDSRWIIKVGAGGLVKTVNVLVHVDQWDGPGRVDFSFKLESEPVIGGGSYIATSGGTNTTDVLLKLRVEGSGPMAPMWEAVSRPLMPQLAKAFSGRLKTEIESITVTAVAEVAAIPENRSLLATIGKLLQRIWRALFGSSKQEHSA